MVLNFTLDFWIEKVGTLENSVKCRVYSVKVRILKN